MEQIIVIPIKEEQVIVILFVLSGPSVNTLESWKVWRHKARVINPYP